MPEQHRVAEIRKVLERRPSLEKNLARFNIGDLVLEEGNPNNRLFAMLKGRVVLRKNSTKGEPILVHSLKPGDLLGLHSFCTQEPGFTTAHVIEPLEVLVFDREEYDQLPRTEPELSQLLQLLVIEDLNQRYRRSVSLQLTLEQEQTRLRETIDELERTRAHLINQEKLATLGQLVAGLAHEMNNPVAALLRNSERLEETLGSLLGAEHQDFDPDLAFPVWKEGLQTVTGHFSQQRGRMDKLEKELPGIGRSLLRRLAALSEPALEILASLIRRAAKEENPRLLLPAIECFETGLFVHTIQLTSGRIGDLVASLRNYARPASSESNAVDIKQGIQDTLLILGNRLKHFQVETELEDLPAIAASPGELNQVWTNILVNACDAMGDKNGGIVRVVARKVDAPAPAVEVVIEDSGPGVPDDIRQRIFDPSFTTKTRGNDFGLGLGLAICQGIIGKHNGSFSVGASPEGGASFKVSLPA